MPVLDPLTELDELLKQAEQIKNFPDEFITPAQNASSEVQYLTGKSTIAVTEGLSESMYSLLPQMLAAANAAALLMTQEEWEKERRRRKPRKRLQVCLTLCASIVGAARLDAIKSMENRALETKPEPRKRRTFKSRK